MRILVLADVHANWVALEAIQEPYDVCLCLGDLVDYGPEPGRCIHWVRHHSNFCVRGNHDHAVAQYIQANGDAGYGYLARATRPLMWQLVGAPDRHYLARLPLTQHLTLDGKRFTLVHATPRDPLDEFLLDDPARWERRLAGLQTDYLCVGHTHKQFCLKAAGCQVVNPGSVGQPRDGDPRAAYAVIDNGHVQLKRAAYNVERTVSALQTTSIPDDAKELAAHVLRTGGK